MILLSQNRSGNNQIKLGTGSKNTTTIASHGCTITCIGMISDLSERKVNELFIQHNVFAQNGPEVFNLVNWTKISNAIPWLKFIWRNVGYDNAAVAKAIADYGFCLVEVKLGNGKHWVVFKGNQKIYDPLDGKEKSTSAYQATGYAIINRVGNPPAQGGNDMANMFTMKSGKQVDLANPESMKVVAQVYDDVINLKLYTRTAEADLKLQNTVKDLNLKHSNEISKINENIAKEKEQAVADALAKKDQYMRSEIAKALKVGEGEEFSDLIYMIKSLKDQLEQPTPPNSNDLDILLAQKGYKIDSIVIKKN